MGRRRRTSPQLEKADLRLQSIKSIEATLDLENGISVAVFETAIDTAQSRLDDYNQLLSSLDEKSVLLREAEKQITDLCVRVLAGIGAKYGKDSAQYAQAGGTRTSDVKRPVRKTTTEARGPNPTP